jgi:hypothetical protein
MILPWRKCSKSTPRTSIRFPVVVVPVRSHVDAPKVPGDPVINIPIMHIRDSGKVRNKSLFHCFFYIHILYPRIFATRHIKLTIIPKNSMILSTLCVLNAAMNSFKVWVVTADSFASLTENDKHSK